MFVIHYGEIGIKGDNRPVFERRLASNIRAMLKDAVPGVEVRERRGLITVETPSDDPRISEDIAGRLRKIPGIEYFIEATRVKTHPQPLSSREGSRNRNPSPERGGAEGGGVLNDILSAAADLYKDRIGTFRVTAKRADKSFPMTSQELAAKAGEAILKTNPDLKVDLHRPDHTLTIEVAIGQAYVAPEKIRGVGGLPVGSSGKIVSMLSGGIDSPVASWMMLKRGAPLHYVSFHNFPYTDRSAIDVVKDIAAHLAKTSGPAALSLFNLTPVQEEIVANCEPKFRVLLYRRMMFRVAERVADRERAKAFVTGESLGQVASQTVENMGVVEAVTAKPIFRPLVGMDKQEIVDLAKRIGTYELSIKPHADCCSLFVPEHPATKARLEDILENEKRLDIEALVEATLNDEELLR